MIVGRARPAAVATLTPPSTTLSSSGCFFFFFKDKPFAIILIKLFFFFLVPLVATDALSPAVVLGIVYELGILWQ
jgi:hypothetical protein